MVILLRVGSIHHSPAPESKFAMKFTVIPTTPAGIPSQASVLDIIFVVVSTALIFFGSPIPQAPLFLQDIPAAAPTVFHNPYSHHETLYSPWYHMPRPIDFVRSSDTAWTQHTVFINTDASTRHQCC